MGTTASEQVEGTEGPFEVEETVGLDGVAADGRVEEVEGLVGVITPAFFLESFALDLVTNVKLASIAQLSDVIGVGVFEEAMGFFPFSVAFLPVITGE